MKIEVGELLVSSYLNHVEQCKIVQTNWRVSGNWKYGQIDSKWAEERFNDIKNNHLLSKIFRDNSFAQLIKQSEIDVIGLNTNENTVYAYDIAFHSMGLNYKGSEETSEIVVKKILRAVFTLKIYFPEFDKIESYFVTPKANKKIDSLINLYLNEANKIINLSSIKIGYISNDNFFETIVDSVIESSKNENDTSELFLRSIKLMSLDKRIKSVSSSMSSPKTKTSPTTSFSKKRTVNGMKIGQYVKNSMFMLFRDDKVTSSEIKNLLDKSYCRRIFKIGFPVLIKNTMSKKDSNGNNRYYKDEVVEGFWLCSQWVESQWDDYLNWESKFK